MKPTDYFDTGFETIIEQSEHTLTNIENLVSRFYELFDFTEKTTLKSLVALLNPEVKGTRIFPNDNIWWLIYPTRFKITISENIRNSNGPHVVKLYYKSWQTGEEFWLATAQISEFFFSEEKILDKLYYEIIFNRDFYYSDRSARDIVTH